MTKTLKIFLLIAAIAVLSGCKKYDEGPLVSLHSKKSRIEGTWKMTRFDIGGQSAFNTAKFNKVCGNVSCEATTQRSYEWIFDKNGYVTVKLTENRKDPFANNCQCDWTYTVASYTATGKWELIDRKNKLKLDVYATQIYFNMEMDIYQLKNNHIKLKCLQGSQFYEIELEK